MKLFPFVHLIALIVGGIILLTVKRKYQKVRNVELIMAFILYFILLALFTSQGIDLVKRFINFIQV